MNKGKYAETKVTTEILKVLGHVKYVEV